MHLSFWPPPPQNYSWNIIHMIFKCCYFSILKCVYIWEASSIYWGHFLLGHFEVISESNEMEVLQLVLFRWKHRMMSVSADLGACVTYAVLSMKDTTAWKQVRGRHIIKISLTDMNKLLIGSTAQCYLRMDKHHHKSMHILNCWCLKLCSSNSSEEEWMRGGGRKTKRKLFISTPTPHPTVFYSLCTCVCVCACVCTLACYWRILHINLSFFFMTFPSSPLSAHFAGKTFWLIHISSSRHKLHTCASQTLA